MTLSAILAALLSPIGRIGGTLAILAIAWFGFAKHYETKGAQKLATNIERTTNAKVKRADAARRAVYGIPDERLRDRYFRD